MTEPDPPETDDVGALRHEAAARRKELRAAEAERDALRERVAGFERDTVNRLAAERLANPADLLLAVQLDDLRDESGERADAVNAAISRVLQDRPHWSKPEPEPEPARAFPSAHNGVRTPAPEPVSFGSLLKDAR